MALMVFYQSAHAAKHSDYYIDETQIGCGTITSVRNVDQEPIESYDLAIARESVNERGSSF